jgi:hypothetical protein
MNLPSEVLASPVGPYDLHCITGGRWLVESLSQSLPIHAPRRIMMPVDPLMDIKE